MHIEDQIFEIHRELEIRERCFPKWIQIGKLSAGAAAQRINALKAVLETLIKVRQDEEKILHQVGKELPY